MTDPAQHRIRSITDLLDLDEADLKRMLPDLVEWHRLSRQINSEIAMAIRHQGFTWVDDGRPGVLDHVRLIDAENPGKVFEVRAGAAAKAPPGTPGISPEQYRRAAELLRESADALCEADEGDPDAIRDRDDSRTCAALLEAQADIAERDLAQQRARAAATQNREPRHG
ncbi:MAG: hypothetical protein HKL99_10815 [Burkholderiales bacterium]|nr:hypothetical protein [Burkholderiales bacterium]